ncbi:hypothetical protein MNBD_GAMMA22-1735 [hydrothermal vent metagenome]|uniref:DUF2835 domain-containing protein n=1 Tax=hydrothermal vent metagenome TaxID=652676 RepID=A0A3B1A9D5_9ZZZZ
MHFTINLHINKSEILKYYSGIKSVKATSTDGRRVQFPVNVLQKFIAHDGIHGMFILNYDDDFKFQDIQKIN